MKLAHDPTHAIIVESALETILAKGRFTRDEVLAGTPFAKFQFMINWGYVREQVEEKLGEQLVPLAASTDEWDEEIHPEKHLPSAHRKTAGYARTSAVAEQVSVMYASRRRNQVAGALESLQNLAIAYEKQGVPIHIEQVNMPALGLAAPAE